MIQQDFGPRKRKMARPPMEVQPPAVCPFSQFYPLNPEAFTLLRRIRRMLVLVSLEPAI
jgi:hypothetical protein